MVAEKDLPWTSNSLISNIEKDLARTGVPWVAEPPKEYVCIMDLARMGNPIRV
ncbi:hypothetical protein F383_35757 [Gossypium arboreum]|uniref:Uncharacterized protein n=2 Tax=Gossypium arboreum TaxID=29729 RepID=A0A0B0Q077_GOSAR|nr:hypothetical protein F383_31186 [Gossypium arboreum]KHG29151.1 hypothetical protein F383_35757 [Gossypium arboreum]